MGNQFSSTQSNEDISRLLLSLENFTLEGQPIDSNKLFTIVKLTPDQFNLLLSKVHVKIKDFDYSSYKQRFDSIKSAFSSMICPNLLFSDYIETSKLLILFRQYCSNTLRKKIISPPFLNQTEKLWLAYQSLLSVKQLHDLKIYHGDIKSENFLVTSWNWLFLSDFSNFFKPSYIAEGDLTSYKYFFSSSERPACYLSPEKIAGKNKEEGVTAEMDIFSLGCVIAEIFLDGQFLFSLADLLSYKRNALKMPSKLAEIKQESIKNMIASMISLLPEDRKSIDHYIKYWETNVISLEMIGLYPFIAHVMIEKNANSPWSRINKVIDFYENSFIEFKNSEVLLILAEYVTGNIRNVNLASSMVKSIEILTSIGEKLSDDSRLHRILPFIISILQNKQEKSNVKVACIRSLVVLLNNIKEISARDSHLFEEYIWPTISSLIHDESDWVRAELASNLPSFGKIGRAFFDVSCFHLSQDLNYDKELSKFTVKFIRIFKELIISKPECQVHIELLRNFAELSEYLDMKSVLNNVIPIVLSWLNKGDFYRVLILSQIPKLLSIIHTPEFFFQIFTCIEDGLTLHNELVVYHTLKVCKVVENIEKNSLKKVMFGLLHPNKWIRDESTAILKSLISKFDDYSNFCILRDLFIDFLDLPCKRIHLIKTETLDHVLPPLTRKSFGPNSMEIYQKVFESFRNKEPSPKIPCVIIEESPQVFEDLKLGSASIIKFPIDSPKTFENLSLKGTLLGCFNEHDSSVTNLCVIESFQCFLSASTDGFIKIWSLSQLEPFQPIKSSDFLSPSNYALKIKSMGNCGENIYIAHDQGIMISPLPHFSIQTSFSVNKLLKAISISENNIASVDQQGLLSIFDIRQHSTVQQHKLGYNYGIVSALCKGPMSSTLALGTFSSTLLMYDMRFACPSMIYSHSSDLPILTMQGYTNNSLLVGGNDIALLDLYSGTASVVLSAYSSVPVTVPSFRENFESEWIFKNCANISHRTRKTFENQNMIRKIISPGLPYVLSAGHDCLVRCWDLESPSKSFVVGQDSGFRNSFLVSQYPDIKIIQESPYQSQGNVQKTVKRKEYSEVPNHRKCSHTDAILDIALVTQPKSILLTASRDGTIKAWN